MHFPPTPLRLHNILRVDAQLLSRNSATIFRNLSPLPPLPSFASRFSFQCPSKRESQMWNRCVRLEFVIRALSSHFFFHCGLWQKKKMIFALGIILNKALYVTCSDFRRTSSGRQAKAIVAKIWIKIHHLHHNHFSCSIHSSFKFDLLCFSPMVSRLVSNLL